MIRNATVRARTGLCETAFWAYNLGLFQTLVNLYPVITLILAALILKEAVGWRVWLAVGLSLGGIAFAFDPVGSVVNEAGTTHYRAPKVVMSIEFHCVFMGLQDTVGGLDVAAIGNGFGE